MLMLFNNETMTVINIVTIISYGTEEAHLYIIWHLSEGKTSVLYLACVKGDTTPVVTLTSAIRGSCIC